MQHGNHREPHRQRGPFWTPITPQTGSFFHAEVHAAVQPAKEQFLLRHALGHDPDTEAILCRIYSTARLSTANRQGREGRFHREFRAGEGGWIRGLPVRDQYAGDVSEFAFLCALAGTDRTLGITWSNAPGSSGHADRQQRHLEWRDEAAWRLLDTELHSGLVRLARAQHRCAQTGSDLAKWRAFPSRASAVAPCTKRLGNAQAQRARRREYRFPRS